MVNFIARGKLIRKSFYKRFGLRITDVWITHHQAETNQEEEVWGLRTCGGVQHLLPRANELEAAPAPAPPRPPRTDARRRGRRPVRVWGFWMWAWA